MPLFHLPVTLSLIILYLYYSTYFWRFLKTALVILVPGIATCLKVHGPFLQQIKDGPYQIAQQKDWRYILHVLLLLMLLLFIPFLLVQASLLLSKISPEIVGEPLCAGRIYDAVNAILSFMVTWPWIGYRYIVVCCISNWRSIVQE